jgi:hypothetical protein
VTLAPLGFFAFFPPDVDASELSLATRLLISGKVVHLLTLVSLLNVVVESSSWSQSICLVILQLKKTFKMLKGKDSGEDEQYSRPLQCQSLLTVSVNENGHPHFGLSHKRTAYFTI